MDADARPSARLFIALWPGPRVRQALAEMRDVMPWPPAARPVATDKLHLTLYFIGNVPATRVGEIASALQVEVRRFELRLDLAECWRGGVVVLAPRKIPARLQSLHADLGQALRHLELPVEARVFRPHVTLARRAGHPGPMGLATALRWRVDGYALVQSMADGSYEVLRRYR